MTEAIKQMVYQWVIEIKAYRDVSFLHEGGLRREI